MPPSPKSITSSPSWTDGDPVHYLEIGAKFLDAEENIPQDVMGDGLHPSVKGYEIWAEAVKEPIAKLLEGTLTPPN